MQRGILTLALSLGLFAISWLATVSPSSADATKAKPTTREAALFIRNAFASSSPFSYWNGGENHSPTIYFYMAHRPWHNGSEAMKREGTKILRCIAGLLGPSRGDGAKPISTNTNPPHRFRILINPLPPGGGTQLAAEGVIQRDGCPEGREQDLILSLLFSEYNRHTF